VSSTTTEGFEILEKAAAGFETLEKAAAGFETLEKAAAGFETLERRAELEKEAEGISKLGGGT